MNKIEFTRARTTLMAGHDAAIVLDGEDPMEALAEAVVEAVSTELEVKLGGQTVHLAMLLNPDHWDEDWRALGVEHPHEFVAGLVTESV